MDLLETAKQKLEYSLSTLESASDYTQHIKLVLAAVGICTELGIAASSSSKC